MKPIKDKLWDRVQDRVSDRVYLDTGIRYIENHLGRYIYYRTVVRAVAFVRRTIYGSIVRGPHE